MVPREVVLGLDKLEVRVSLTGAVLAFALAAYTAFEWMRNAATLVTQKPPSSNACPPGFHFTHSLCSELLRSTRAEWELKFFFLLVVALCLLYFTLRQKRAGVVCFAIFLGFGLGPTTGLAFFSLGAWLVLRAFRLQKYGDASFFASSRVATERGREKREQRKVNAVSRSTKISTPKSTSVPTASKRYTPKKPPRRR